MPLIFQPHSARCRALVGRLRAVETQRPCGPAVEVLVLAMGRGFDVTVSLWAEPKHERRSDFVPFRSPRWSLPMSEEEAVAAFQDWAAKGYPGEEEPIARPNESRTGSLRP